LDGFHAAVLGHHGTRAKRNIALQQRMCGINGYWRWQRDLPQQELLNIIFGMSQAIMHRGPDGDGYWADAALGLALGHRRLSILDLSSAGAQPMVSADGNGILILNGEIYNFNELRAELDAQNLSPAWRGHSDTEILLACLRAYGVTATLAKIQGMFAFAYADLNEKKLFLARDRFGEKPLYFYQDDIGFAFGSELKAIRTLPHFDAALSRNALAEYMAYAYVPGEQAIYGRAHKLAPGHYMVIDLAHAAAPQLKQIAYWSALNTAKAARQNLIHDEASAIDQLLLKKSVQAQMVADVPLGAFLSGGIDSSAVVALMQANSTQKIKTYSIGFTEASYNEADYARAVAAHIGTDHHEYIVTPQEAMNVIPHLPAIYDEPFGDSSQIPTFLVSQLARRDVTVTLSGDAGDELFGGYNRYFLTPRIWQCLRPLPTAMRHAFMNIITKISPGNVDATVRALSAIIPKLKNIKLAGDKFHKLAGLLDAPDEHGLYHRLHTFWPLDIVQGADGATHETIDDVGSLMDDMMLHDTINYLPGDVLVKLDRASMAVSLESRVPFLNTDLFSFAWSLAPELKTRGGKGKYVLRQMLYRHVPPALIDRPKMGFGVPIGDWLKGPLRPWAEELLTPEKLSDGGYLHAAPILKKWQEHQSGVRNWHYYLWPVLMFQAWRCHPGN
jgi:asparagine synthase (glutamine-hydrolysing)